MTPEICRPNKILDHVYSVRINLADSFSKINFPIIQYMRHTPLSQPACFFLAPCCCNDLGSNMLSHTNGGGAYSTTTSVDEHTLTSRKLRKFE